MKNVGNSRFQKRANAILILNALRKGGPYSRANLARTLGLQPSTVTYIVNRLLLSGLVREEQKERKAGSGRKAIELAIVETSGYTIGIDLQADYFQFVVADLAGKTFLSGGRHYSLKAPSFDILLEQVLDEILGQIDSEKEKILYACVALPGIVDSETGTIVDCWTHGLKDYDLPEWLESKYDFPFLLENDANCCAWNNLENSRSFVYLLTRFHKEELVAPSMPVVGVGLGVALKGEVFKGFANRAGEFRSFLYEGSGTGQISLSLEEQKDLVNDRELRRKLLYELLKNVLFLVPILNLQKILIGGDFQGEAELVQDILDNELLNDKNFMKSMGCSLSVLPEDSSWDVAKGAAKYCLNRLFSIPKIGEETHSTPWLHSLSH